jgi:hypothetical protein
MTGSDDTSDELSDDDDDERERASMPSIEPNPDFLEKPRDAPRSEALLQIIVLSSGKTDAIERK